MIQFKHLIGLVEAITDIQREKMRENSSIVCLEKGWLMTLNEVTKYEKIVLNR